MQETSTTNNLTVQFSQTQFFRLLDLAYVGMWMITASEAIHTEEDPYKELEQHLFSQAKLFSGQAHFQTIDDEVMFTEEYEEMLQRIINAYDNEIFWDALAHRLAKRDIVGDVPQSVEMNSRVFMEIFNREIEYMKEFGQNGVKHIKVPSLC
ncbi:hypothetical protein FZC66_08000 [Priestia megaterium]|nr:hypothetical protein FZC66_08000 [Priestia megaterium]